MPYIVTGEPNSQDTADFRDKDYNYTYPHDLNLHPSSDLHKKIRNKIWNRAQSSRMEISKRFDTWREIDRTMTAYIPLKDKEKKLKKKDPNKPVSIVFPYSYAVLESLLTYLTRAYFQDPIFQYEGHDSKDILGAMLLEEVIKMHCIKNKVSLAIHTILRDSLCYGVGIGIPEWTRHYGKRPIKSEVSTISELGRETTGQIVNVQSLLFEGNSLTNIDPYMWLPDPTVSSTDIQKGEFVGWIERDNYMNILSEENQPDSRVFNAKYLKHCKEKRSTLALDNSDREKRYGKGTSSTSKARDVTNPVDRIKMYINIIPKDWELSPSEYPEKWYFELSSDDIITSCYKADHNHGMYPMGVASPEFDGYSITPISRMEVMYGMQTTLNFLFNSHVENLRKSINDMFVVDPFLVNINDLKDPEPGKLIRLQAPAWGRGVDKVVQQLQVNDITRANIADGSYITQQMDRISGADQSMQGQLRQGGPERLTSSEFQGTRGSAMSRLQRMAMIISTQFMQDMATMFAVHTQQYMSQDTFVKIAGNNAENLKQYLGEKRRAKVALDDLIIDYDVIPRDGSIPGGGFSDTWIELFKIIGTSEQLTQQFDVVKIFSFIAHEMGAKNVEQFKRNINNIQQQTMPDDQLQQQVKQGNMVPVGE